MALIKLNNRSIKDVTSLPFGVGTLVHIQSQTASNSASISFTTGIDSTYKEYQFYFIDIHPRTDVVDFVFNGSTDGGSNYNVTKTTTQFDAYHSEAGTNPTLNYNPSYDLAQSTSFQIVSYALSADADGSTSGYMSLFNPASTTYVKHFIAVTNETQYNDYNVNNYMAGYMNTTSAVNAVQFKMSSGNFDGTIAMFGVL